MSTFKAAIPILLDHEGPDSIDQGGITRWGVTLALLEGEAAPCLSVVGKYPLTGADIAVLSQDECSDLWRIIVWERLRLFELNSQDVATKILDTAAPFGSAIAICIAQRACRAAGQRVLDDGRWGPLTLAALQAARPGPLLAALRSEAAAEFRLVLAKHPEWEQDRIGWLERAYE